MTHAHHATTSQPLATTSLKHAPTMSSEDLNGRSISAGSAFRIQYSSGRLSSSWRTVLAERPGVVAETRFGKAQDTAPGWWMHHDGTLKFFHDRRLIVVIPVSALKACRYDDCPQQLRDTVAAAAGVDRGASPARSGFRSRSRCSRSRSRNRLGLRSPVSLSRKQPRM